VVERDRWARAIHRKKIPDEVPFDGAQNVAASRRPQSFHHIGGRGNPGRQVGDA
jgi:hypothetical protein